MPVDEKNRVRVTLATSHIDRHNSRMTKGALESALKAINSSRKPRLSVEHNMTIPPLGRINEAELVQGEDGEFYLYGYYEYYEKREAISLKDGTMIIKEKFVDEKSRFSEVQFEVLEKTRISVDRENFEDHGIDDFFEDLRREANLEFESKEHVRKSFIPDPEVIIELSKAAAIYFLGKELLPKLAGKVADEISVDIVGLYRLIKTSAELMIAKSIPKKRPITYFIKINGDINIEFVAISPTANDLINGLSKTKFEPLVEQIKSLNLFFDLDKVQFILNSDGEWEFNYALSRNGESIGTEKTFKKRDKIFSELSQKMIEDKEVSQSNVVDQEE